MKIECILSLCAFFSFSFQSWGQNQSLLRPVVLSSELELPASRWMVDGSPLPKGSPLVVRLMKSLREQERDGRSAQCRATAKRVGELAPSLKAWLVNVELNCAINESKASSSLHRYLKETLASVDKNSIWLLDGPQVQALKKSYIQAFLLLLNSQIKSNRRQAWKSIGLLIARKDWLESSQLAQVYYLAGELAFIQQNLSLAVDSFQRSYQIEASPEIALRLDSIRAKITQEGVKSAESGEKKDQSQLGLEVEASEEENKLYQRVKSALDAGDSLAVVEDAVSLIKKFPGSRRADWAGDRAFDILKTLAASGDSKYRILSDRVLDQLESVDSGRQVEWAKVLFYRAYYLESLRLADASLKKLEGKEVSTALLLAGQAAVFLGDYKLAEERFNRLIYEHSGTEPAAEGLFRLGLVYLRQKKFTLAVAVFERLLALPQIDKWDLASRYWLWRSLEQMKSDRVKSEAEKLVTRFPLTYYGLRARAESNDNKLVFDGGANAAVKVELWLTEPENQAWERFQILLRAGWLMEAQAELEELPSPHSPEEKIVRAKLRSLAFDHFGAIRLVNEAWEENPELLKPALFGLSFPFEFVSLVNKYSKVQGLNSSLVMGLIKQESSFRPEVMSSSRAAGLMQIVSITARDSAQYLKYKKKLSFPEDLFDPDLNIQFGSSYLRRMVRAFDGHLPLALASYNLGIGRLRKWLSYREELGDLSSKTSKDPFEDLWIDELPWAETCFYVKAVLRNFLVYSILKGEKVELSGPFWAKAIK